MRSGSGSAVSSAPRCSAATGMRRACASYSSAWHQVLAAASRETIRDDDVGAAELAVDDGGKALSGQRLLDVAEDLEGQRRQASRHAAPPAPFLARVAEEHARAQQATQHVELIGSSCRRVNRLRP